MKNSAPLLSVNEALSTLLAAATQAAISDPIHLPTLSSNGRILAADICATMDVPSAENSQMDGYALNSADAHSKTPLLISQRIAAGHIGTALQPGTVARIFTGAIMPDGADTVVMQEQCEVIETPQGAAVRLLHTPQAGEWVRHIGEDIRRGSVILSAGTRLRAQELGLAASVGFATLPVQRPLRVAVFFTGDELVMPGEPLPVGAIYNSNRFLITALLENLGCQIHDYGIVPDTLVATRATLKLAAQENDVVITSGGVSVGDEDHIKPAVQAEGRLNLWQIAVKPGKPLAFGEVGSAFFLGLPGNPVSSFVTFLLFVRPFLLRLQGVTDVAPKSYTMRADFTWAKADKRNEFLRAKLNANGGLDLYPSQGSAVLSSTVWGDGLVDNPAGQTIQTGDMVKFIPFSEIL
ncbi:gephyrin-like molybdotransferase Glp [Solimicrobium silvestre]|uniref:Molybdopterin molybdenumtransferase n=1 Tax=Solimicrobium silvestre TaxID=2099400 RepID=A0A2S9GXD2_9BURK|nr:gephyrin-like molybdotransferase Glp [Solimicrobium silvestre]PRC92373.1 Molybdenum cofactor synthesis domain [Solimicrobium silvestre]